MEIKDGNYYVVQSFMVKELKLKGLQKEVYAIIYGFSQANQKFTGSLSYLAAWTSSTKQGVIKALTALCESGLIVKEDKSINGVKFVEYYATEFNGMQLSLTGGMQLSCPNKIDNNNLVEERKGATAKTRPTFDEIINNYSEDEAIRFRLKKWLEVRKLKRAASTNYAIEKNLEKLKGLATASNMKVAEYLDEIIMRGWTAFYEIKKSNFNNVKVEKLEDLTKKGNSIYG